MNAAFLLLTACMAGQNPAPAAAPAPAPAAAAPVVSTGSCCGGCASTVSSCGSSCGCEDSGRVGLFARLRGRFSRSNDCCDSCAPVQTCCKPAPVCCKPAPVCCKPAPVCCQPAPTCHNSCDDGCHKPNLFDRIRGRFKRGCDEGCDTCGVSGGCGGCGVNGTIQSVPANPGAPAGEPIKSVPVPATMPNKTTSIISPIPGTIALGNEQEGKHPF